MEIIAENFLRPLIRVRLDAAPCAVGIVSAKARPVVVGAVVDVLTAVSGEDRKHICCVNTRIGQHLQNSGVVRHGRIGRELIRQHLRRHRDKDGLHRNALCRQLFL